MAYRKVYFRIRTEAYVSERPSEADKAAFKEESRSLFQELGWTLEPGRNGVCDTVIKDRQDLYLHPSVFSGVMEEANMPFGYTSLTIKRKETETCCGRFRFRTGGSRNRFTSWKPHRST